jgi:hypothetical protein
VVLFGIRHSHVFKKAIVRYKWLRVTPQEIVSNIYTHEALTTVKTVSVSVSPRVPSWPPLTCVLTCQQVSMPLLPVTIVCISWTLTWHAACTLLTGFSLQHNHFEICLYHCVYQPLFSFTTEHELFISSNHLLLRIWVISTI